ncbi:MAG: crotonase/enoyl-CoA hydratase family protein [Colwellia sp.]|jgi:enoyl-CoA hydratase|uniref:crotonase/enoyl-CoA hydratase family protein n=1 Tax=Colwellia sp. Bg11-12 TaxID=2759817 RepID=UPI0015F41D58|nr:crotonase/enoyl-CoA hydratase family protein [Colwellia sp. Bg11-12]MBA6265303.1 crotonase/enoyl-CoA hydratase family protein [Colwellia sp. Bg11-12]
MELIDFELNENIATITLKNGKVNAISHQVITEINSALDQAEAASAAVILTSQPGIFSGGYDLKTMKESSDSAVSLVTAGSTLTRRMLSFPFPIVGACTGHAIAKGAFLLLSCDYRIGSIGSFKIGLNEVAIGMTMHQAGLELARNRVPINYLTRSVINAELFDPQTAVLAGFLDTLVEPEALMATAKAAATQLLTLNMTAHHGTKLRERKQILTALDAAIAIDSTMTLDL